MKRILLISASPYIQSSNTRYFNTLFSDEMYDNLFNLYTRDTIVKKPSCALYYKICDKDLIKHQQGSFLDFSKEKVLSTVNTNSGKRYNKNKSNWIYYLRDKLWSSGRWRTDNLLKKLDEFSPEIILLNCSDYMYLGRIALILSERYSIKIVPIIVDNYLFTKRKSLLFKNYLLEYKRVYSTIIQDSPFSIFISDRILNKYQEHLKMNGVVFYTSSELTPQTLDISFIKRSIKVITYLGSLSPKRYLTLEKACKIAKQNGILLRIFSSEKNKRIIKRIIKAGGSFEGEIDYCETIKTIKESDCLFFCEAFDHKTINSIADSFSTKIPDYIFSGKLIVCFAPEQIGSIEYLKNYRGCIIANSETQLNDVFMRLSTGQYPFCDLSNQKNEHFIKNHLRKTNNERFNDLIAKI